MIIEQAPRNDLPAIAELFAACIRDMTDRGIDQWDESYPGAEINRRDYEDGSLFAGYSEGSLVGAFTIDENQAAEYKRIPWRYVEGKILVVHRLAVHPKFQHRGIARELMAFAEEFGINRGYAAIRLDAYSANHRAIPFYEKLGYEHRGQVNFARRELPYYVFEKSLLERNENPGPEI